LAKIWPARQTNSPEVADRRLELHKRSQLFIGSHNETLSIVALRVSNEDRSPARINGCNAAPTPAGPAEIVGDDFPVFHGCDLPDSIQFDYDEIQS
jgi:hypothetical protein